MLQASVTLLERLPVVLEKSSEHDLHHFILPLLFNALDSKMSQIQVQTRMQLRSHGKCQARLYLASCKNVSLLYYVLSHVYSSSNPASSLLPAQMAAVSIIPSVLDYFDDDVVRNQE